MIRFIFAHTWIQHTHTHTHTCIHTCTHTHIHPMYMHTHTHSQEYGLTHNMKVPMGFYIEEYHLDMLPLDHDVISLDINSAFTVSSGERVGGGGDNPPWPVICFYILLPVVLNYDYDIASHWSCDWLPSAVLLKTVFRIYQLLHALPSMTVFASLIPTPAPAFVTLRTASDKSWLAQGYALAYFQSNCLVMMLTQVQIL